MNLLDVLASLTDDEPWKKEDAVALKQFRGGGKFVLHNGDVILYTPKGEVTIAGTVTVYWVGPHLTAELNCVNVDNLNSRFPDGVKMSFDDFDAQDAGLPQLFPEKRLIWLSPKAPVQDVVSLDLLVQNFLPYNFSLDYAWEPGRLSTIATAESFVRQGNRGGASGYPIKFRNREWVVSLGEVKFCEDPSQDMSPCGNFAISHICRIAKHDGGSFSPLDTKGIKNTLWGFLTFIRGAAVGFPLAWARNAIGEITWVNPVNPCVDPRFDSPIGIWRKEKFPAGLFDPFRDLWRSRQFQWALSLLRECKAVDSTEHIKVIKAVEALTVLSALYVRRFKPKTGNMRGGNEYARALLRDLNLEHDQTKNTFKELDKHYQTYRQPGYQGLKSPKPPWLDYIDMLYAMRNAYTHFNEFNDVEGDADFDKSIADIIWQPRMLLCWWLDLAVLKLLGYNGTYWNSIVEDNMAVPWCRSEKGGDTS